jgi:hypothetical protein
MTKLAGIVCAAACLVGGLFLPQAASASTYLPEGASATLTFDGVSAGDITVNFKFYTDFAGSLTVDLGSGFYDVNGRDQYLSDTNGSGGVTFNSVNGSSSPFSVSFTNTTGAALDFDAFVGGQSDSVTVTPIPSSILLFLTGAVVVFGLARRRGSGRGASENFAT